MSAVPASSPLSSPVPAAARRHAPEREAAREAPAFSLPADAAEGREPGIEVEKGASAPAAKPGEPKTSLAAGAGTAAQEPELSVPPGTHPAPIPPPAIVTSEAPAPAATLAKPDVGVLVAIAEAQGILLAVEGETAAPSEATGGEDKAEPQPGAMAGATAMPLPVLPDSAATIATFTPAPAGAPEAAQSPAAGGSTVAIAAPADAPATSPATGSQVAAAAETAPAEPAHGPAPGLPGALAAIGAIATSSPAAPGEPGEQPAPLATGGRTPDAGASAFQIADARGADAAKAGSTTEEQPAGTKATEAVAAGQASAAPGTAAETSHAAAEGASPRDAGRAGDAAQPVPTIDPGTIIHQRTGRSEPPVAGTEPSVLPQQSGMADGQGTADGAPTPLHVVPVEIGLRALAGSKRFDIRLDPAELGRVDVNLEISDEGEVSARLVVDRVETLHLLQRDARTLERAFEQAGLKPSDAGVDIMLRDPGDQSGFRQQRQHEQASHPERTLRELSADEGATAVQPVPIRRLVRLGGVDLSI